MERRSTIWRSEGFTLLEFVVLIVFLIVVAAVLFPIFVRDGERSPRNSCQNNLKELATAMMMYWNDYDGTLPSSVLHQGMRSGRWNVTASAEFCSERGKTPPPSDLRPEDVHWVQLLWPKMKNRDIIWCRLDPEAPHAKKLLGMQYGRVQPGPKSLLSYIYKPAVDRAWFAGFRREEQYEFVADQIVFFEHTGWHWGDRGRGWRDGVTLNAAFMDGHVRSVRLTSVSACPVPNTSSELARRMAVGGEPLWFNYDRKKTKKGYKGECGRLFDAGRYYDNLP